MRKLILFLLVFVSAKVSAQVYQEMPQYGYRANRMAFDSTLQIPTVCGVPTLKSVVKTNKSGAIAYDSCNARFYAYNPKTLTWTAITSGSADTTSLSNRINLKIDSLKRSNDSVFAYRNGTRVFQFKDSVGSGATPTLQQVTTVGATTTNNITVNGLTLGSLGNGLDFTGNTDQLAIRNVGTSDNLLEINYSPTGSLKWGGGTYPYVEISNSTVGNVILQTPSTSGTIPISVNGYTANIAGAITIPTGGVAVDTIFRTLGKDSIFYKKNSITYAIKDSVGTNPAPVGYYGAFQDTTTQTALVTNTAYGVKLGVTDLTNGVTVANNSKIKISNAGIYNIQFSLQLEKTGGSGNMIADIWLRKNNVNLAGTNGKIVLTGSANASPIVAAWNYVVAVSSNDSLELMWATDNLNVKIISDIATSPHPSTSSAILTVTQQSGIMAGTGISPLDTSNMLLPYLRKIDTASLSNRINFKLNSTDTSSLSNRINQTPTITGYQLLGSNIKAFPLGITGFAHTTAVLAHVNQRMTFVAFYIPQTTTVTGVKYITTSAGTSFVGNANYNGFALYSYNIGTGLATRIDSTANDNTIWTTTGTQLKAFVTPTSLSPGIYYLGYLCQGTATTFPSIAQNPQLNGVTTYDFTSPGRITGYVTGTSTPATFNLSTATANTNLPIIMLY
jgi:hypothetical protein